MFNPINENDPLALEFKRIEEIKERANKLLEQHGLFDWSFIIDKSLMRVGQCRFREKEIAFSETYINSSWSEIEDTILHEIAHALVGPHHGHDRAWKLKCVEIGARPERLASVAAVSNAKPNYYMECPICKRKWYRFRMRKRNFGSKCPDCHIEVKIYKVRK